MNRYAALSVIVLAAVGCARDPYRAPPEEVVVENYIHRYGCEVPSEDWEKSGCHGQVVTTLKNGVVVTKTFQNGILEGDTTYTFPHSTTVEKIETYSQNGLVKEVTRDVSGCPLQQTQYEPSNAKRTVTSWMRQGLPKCVETFEGETLVKGDYYNPAQHLEAVIESGEGTRTRRDFYGQMEAVETVRGGSVVLIETYHPNGAIKAQTAYNNGVVDGVVKTFTPDGEPLAIETWAHGRQSGPTTVYVNGAKFAEVPYLNGQKEGIETRYRDNGEVAEEISWVHNLRQGPTKIHVGDGLRIDWYLLDQPVSKKQYDDATTPRYRVP